MTKEKLHPIEDKPERQREQLIAELITGVSTESYRQAMASGEGLPDNVRFYRSVVNLLESIDSSWIDDEMLSLFQEERETMFHRLNFHETVRLLADLNQLTDSSL